MAEDGAQFDTKLECLNYEAIQADEIQYLEECAKALHNYCLHQKCEKCPFRKMRGKMSDCRLFYTPTNWNV